MVKKCIWLVLLFTVLFSATAHAVVQIVSSSPKKFIQGDYPSNQLPLDIYFDKWLPDDINGSNVGARVKVYVRSEGNFQQLFTSGWTPDSQSCWFPTALLKNKGFLQVKVTVDGVDSNVFSIPIYPPPTQPPAIINVTPNHFDVTDGSSPANMDVLVSNIDGYGFSGVLVDGKPIFISHVVLLPGDDTGGTIVTGMPKELLTKSGTHTIQVTTRAGKSNIVNVTVGVTNIIKQDFNLRKVSTPPKKIAPGSVQQIPSNATQSPQ